MAIKAVLFDMDGTIVDSEDLHTKALQEVVKENTGIELSKEEIEESVGLSYSDKLKKNFEKRNIKEDYFKLAQMCVQRSVELSSLVKRIDGAEETIKKIKKNFKTGLVTASSREQTKSILEEVGLEHYFDIIVTSSNVGRNKPYPDSYLLAAEKLNAKPQECVVIEDSLTGIQTSNNAGMPCIIIRNKYNMNQDLSKANLVVDNIKEISTDMINSLDKMVS